MAPRGGEGTEGRRLPSLRFSTDDEPLSARRPLPQLDALPPRGILAARRGSDDSFDRKAARRARDEDKRRDRDEDEEEDKRNKNGHYARRDSNEYY